MVVTPADTQEATQEAARLTLRTTSGLNNGRLELERCVCSQPGGSTDTRTRRVGQA